jgi:hypothetical protein
MVSILLSCVTCDDDVISRKHNHHQLLKSTGKRYWSLSTSTTSQIEIKSLPSSIFETTTTKTLNRIQQQEKEDPSLSASFSHRNLKGTVATEGQRRTEEGQIMGSDSFMMSEGQEQYGIGNPNYRQQHEQGELPKRSKSTKQGKGKGSPSQNSPRPPSRPPSPTRPPSPSGVDPQPPSGGGGGNGGGQCQDPVRISFLQFSAVPPAIFVYPNDPNPQDVGTRYVYNSDLRDPTSFDELIGSRSNGVCTRTQSRLTATTDESVVQNGGGHCSFTYTLNDSTREITLEVSGTVFDSVGGTLSIVGGTRDTIGAFGQVELVRGKFLCLSSPFVAFVDSTSCPPLELPGNSHDTSLLLFFLFHTKRHRSI